MWNGPSTGTDGIAVNDIDLYWWGFSVTLDHSATTSVLNSLEYGSSATSIAAGLLSSQYGSAAAAAAVLGLAETAAVAAVAALILDIAGDRYDLSPQNGSYFEYDFAGLNYAQFNENPSSYRCA